MPHLNHLTISRIHFKFLSKLFTLYTPFSLPTNSFPNPNLSSAPISIYFSTPVYPSAPIQIYPQPLAPIYSIKNDDLSSQTTLPTLHHYAIPTTPQRLQPQKAASKKEAANLGTTTNNKRLINVLLIDPP